MVLRRAGEQGAATFRGCVHRQHRWTHPLFFVPARGMGDVRAGAVGVAVFVYNTIGSKNHNPQGTDLAAHALDIFFIKTPKDESLQKSRGANVTSTLNA